LYNYQYTSDSPHFFKIGIVLKIIVIKIIIIIICVTASEGCIGITPLARQRALGE